MAHKRQRSLAMHRISREGWQWEDVISGLAEVGWILWLIRAVPKMWPPLFDSDLEMDYYVEFHWHDARCTGAHQTMQKLPARGQGKTIAMALSKAVAMTTLDNAARTGNAYSDFPDGTSRDPQGGSDVIRGKDEPPPLD